MMIRWWEHGEKGVTDRETDGRTENTICRAAWSQLKIQYGWQVVILKAASLPIHIQSLTKVKSPKTKKANKAARQPF